MAKDDIEIALLEPADAHRLAPLIAAYAQDRKRGAPRQPDQYYAEMVLGDRTAEILGARVDGELVGFAAFFDLPDMIAGLRTCQVDEFFVLPAHRRKGIGNRMFDALAAEGRKRSWLHLRWIVDDRNPTAKAFSEGRANVRASHYYETEI